MAREKDMALILLKRMILNMKVLFYYNHYFE